MFVRLVDKDNWKSPILQIHNDEEEFLSEIEKWKKDLLEWVANNTDYNGTPLARLDVNTCIVDLLRHITDYYVKTTPNCDSRIIMTLRLVEEDYAAGEDIMEIKTYE